MQQCVRHASTAVNNAAQSSSRYRKWIWAGAGVAGIAVLAGSSSTGPQLQGSGVSDQEPAQSPSATLGFLQQQLSRAASALWPSNSSSSKQHHHQQQPDAPSLAAQALAKARATSARWLAQWAEDPEAREALLAFGSSRLLDFLIDTATEDPCPEQAHAEQALCNFLAGHHTCSRLLARPGAVPRLLQHVASGKASEELLAALMAVLAARGADFAQQGLQAADGRELIAMLGGRQGQQVQGLALQFLTAWAAAGPAQMQLLSGQGLAPALGRLAMDAVAQGEQGRALQAAVCRLQRLLLSRQGTVSDADLAGWMQPLLFMAADAAAAAAAAAASAGKGVIAPAAPASPAVTAADEAGSGSSLAHGAGAPSGSTAAAGAATGGSGGVGVLGLAAGAADLAIADSAMTTLAAAVAAGGPEVQAALRGLHLLPTLDCLALSPDPAMKARAAAALAALVTAGLVESEEARSRWREMLLTWLIGSTASTLKEQLSTNSSSSAADNGSSSSSSENEGRWSLSSWLKGSGSDREAAEGGDGVAAADAALARSCVAALRALSQEPGPAGLSVAQLWLSRLLLQLSSRVAAYTSITTLAPAPAAPAAALTARNSGSSMLRHALPKGVLADSQAPAAAAAEAGLADAAAAEAGLADAAAAEAGLADAAAATGGGDERGVCSSAAAAAGGEADSGTAGSPAGSTGFVRPAGLSSSSASSISSGSSWWLLGGRWWWWGSGASSSGAASLDTTSTPPNDVTADVTEAVWSQMEAAKAAHWRDAAPVTPAYAKAAAEELKAASLAMLSSWQAAPQQLALPSDLVPGMFVPAVVEAYPAAARVVDVAVAQQRTTHVMELLASVVAEDPTKQAWLLAAGILPIMERLVLHADAGMDPEAFVAKYSSSGSSSSSSEDAGSDGSSSGLSLSARIGRGFWAWGSSSSSGGDAAGGAAAAAAGSDSKCSTDDSRSVMSGGSSAGRVDSSSRMCKVDSIDSVGSGATQAVQQQDSAAAARLAASQQPALLGLFSREGSGFWAVTWGSSSSSSELDAAAAAAAGTGANAGCDLQQQQQHWLHLPVQFECGFGCEFHSDVKSWRDSGGVAATGSSADAAGSLAAWVASGGPLPKFKAAALSTSTTTTTTTTSSSSKYAPAAAASSSKDSTSSSIGKEQDSSSTAASSAAEGHPSQQLQQQQPPSKSQQQQSIPPAVLMEFAQGAAGWDLNPGAPNPAADAATAITAAAEEHPSWIDGEGLGFLCLQRQVARLLGMLALQPAAAGQMAGAAQELPGGAMAVLGLLAPGVNHVRPSGKPQTPGWLLQQGRQPGSSSGSSSWLLWLLAAAASDDCLLSSYAVMALLHLESAAAHHQHERRLQQRCYRHIPPQQQHFGVLAPDNSSSSSSIVSGKGSSGNGVEAGGAVGLSNRWRQRIAEELTSAEDLATFLEDLWPFSSSSSSSSDGVWRPPLYFPDGIHLLNPTSSHHWGLLQPPPITLLESLSAAATAAASAAVAAAASDLSQFDIDVSDAAALDPAAAAAAAAVAAAAAASVLGADTSQLQHSGTSSSTGLQGSGTTNSTSGSISSSSTANGNSSSSSAELGFVQPAVVWLAQKLVKFAEIKEEQAAQEQQRQAHAASQEASNPAAPLSTFAAVQALLTGGGSTSSDSAAAAAAGSSTVPEQQQSPAAPEFDVVFIHGIRGGPFVTWRKGGTHRHTDAISTDAPAAAADTSSSSSSSKPKGRIPLTPSAAQAAHKNHMTRADCWPASWLAADLPGARLLSVEYKAPMTGWEGESLSLPDSGRLLLDKLLAAGVGERPVVFVAHSMGGLLVKEMLCLSLGEPSGSKRARLAAATKAIAFYSTPHFGSSIAALGWKLRHLPGASPAPSIHHLSPGPHLAALNARLSVLHDSGRVQVLSFTEGMPTSLAGLGFIPKVLIVPFESAYPGFGAVHVLESQDHIDVCKPDSRRAPAYVELLQFVRASMAAAGVAAAAVAAAQEGGGSASGDGSGGDSAGDGAAAGSCGVSGTGGADVQQADVAAGHAAPATE